MSITRADGHPVTNPAGSTFVDNQNGPVYFYIDGTTTLNLPAGEYGIVATHGPFSLPETKTVRVVAGQETDAELNVQIGELCNEVRFVHVARQSDDNSF